MKYRLNQCPYSVAKYSHPFHRRWSRPVSSAQMSWNHVDFLVSFSGMVMGDHISSASNATIDDYHSLLGGCVRQMAKLTIYREWDQSCISRGAYYLRELFIWQAFLSAFFLFVLSRCANVIIGNFLYE